MNSILDDTTPVGRFHSAKTLAHLAFHTWRFLSPAQKDQVIIHLHYILSCSGALLKANADEIHSTVQELQEVQR